VFFFLPNLALLLLMPEATAATGTRVGGEPDMGAALQAVGSIYGQVWWQILIVTLISAVGMLGLLALLTDHNRPTVGEALKAGAVYLIPYIGAQFVIALMAGLIILVPVAVGIAAGAVPGALVGIVATVAVVYMYTKLSLTIPVIVVEDERNSLNALRRSWSMTKGNSLRLFLFYMLIFVVFVVVSMVLGIVASAVSLVVGKDANIIINGLLGALVNMGMVTVYLAVLAAVHRQLSGNVKAVGATFE
jgi:hypothetical protein